MSQPAPKIPSQMTVAEFIAWNAPEGARRQLVEGSPEAMAPTSRTHSALLIEIGALISRHLSERSSPCTVLGALGIVPRVRADVNFRIPDLAVTCTPYAEEEHALSDPVVIIEILSPSNKAETWANVWTYTTIPTVMEIAVVSSTDRSAQLLRRMKDGSWPTKPELVESGDFVLDSIGFRAPLDALYRTTRLAG
ncbi:MAG: Uma2 family endonuclease [Alphaproteobacteria bacterium]|nr:Uma2 family endonuclease [Alphaproteobacteria bacterium]